MRPFSLFLNEFDFRLQRITKARENVDSQVDLC
jgi:hypothetical protein